MKRVVTIYVVYHHLIFARDKIWPSICPWMSRQKKGETQVIQESERPHEVLADAWKWPIHEWIQKYVWLSIRLNNLISGHKTNWNKMSGWERKKVKNGENLKTLMPKVHQHIGWKNLLLTFQRKFEKRPNLVTRSDRES